MVLDALGRPLGSLRISVTDRCNLRCSYCMPERDYVWLPRESLLTFRELVTVARAFADLGVSRLRLTGGEPLVRADVAVLVGMLAEQPGISDLALTTNGVLLRALAPELKSAGLHRVTVSLDTLSAERFHRLTGREHLASVLDGIEAAVQQSFRSVKINMVVVRGFNDDEINPMLDYGRARGAEVRFIEYMDVGGATRWSAAQVFSRRDILAAVSAARGPVRAFSPAGAAPADRFELSDGTVFGIISSTTAPFCRSCDRARLTADGMLYTCLYARDGVDLRAVLRGGTPAELSERLRATWQRRTDRGAETRLGLAARAPLAAKSELRQDPHLEMHTRGG